MKLSFTILTVFLLSLLPIYLTAQEEIETETITIIVADELVEVEGIEGKRF